MLNWPVLLPCCWKAATEQTQHVQPPEYFRCAVNAYLENCNKATGKGLSPFPARNIPCDNKPLLCQKNWGLNSITLLTTRALHLLFKCSFLYVDQAKSKQTPELDASVGITFHRQGQILTQIPDPH